MVDVKLVERPSISDVRVLVGEYSFVVSNLKVVRVKLWRSDSADVSMRYEFTQSHYFHGPQQAGPYMTSSPYGETEETALQLALMTLLMYLPSPISKDANTDEWFVRNEEY